MMNSNIVAAISNEMHDMANLDALNLEQVEEKLDRIKSIPLSQIVSGHVRSMVDSMANIVESEVNMLREQQARAIRLATDQTPLNKSSYIQAMLA